MNRNVAVVAMAPKWMTRYRKTWWQLAPIGYLASLGKWSGAVSLPPARIFRVGGKGGAPTLRLPTSEEVA